MKISVYQFSSVPPPIGGNTVHVIRLHKSLQRSAIFDSYVIDPRHKITEENSILALPKGTVRKVSTLARLISRMPKKSIVHFHFSYFGTMKWIAPFLLLFFFRQKKVVTIHSGSFVRKVNRPLIRPWVAFILKSMDHVIAVNALQAEFVEGLGVAADRISVIPAFISEVGSSAELSEEHKEILDVNKVVLTSGSLERLYRYEVILDAFTEESESRLPDGVVLAFAFYNKTDENYAAEILPRIESLPSAISFHDLSPAGFVALMERCDIYVRATATDGDAVAVREAIAMGIPVLATDCVPRPSECQLFKDGDRSKLRELLSAALISSAPLSEERGATTDNAERIADVYTSLFDE